MDYLLTEEQMMVRDLACRIADEKIRPVAAELDEREEFPWEIMKVLAESDLCGIYGLQNLPRLLGYHAME